MLQYFNARYQYLLQLCFMLEIKLLGLKAVNLTQDQKVFLPGVEIRRSQLGASGTKDRKARRQIYDYI